jgi:hypothetical protein
MSAARRLRPLLLALAGCVAGALQGQTGRSPEGADRYVFELPADTLGIVDTLTGPARVPRYTKAMIVPFDMTYYLSDADHDLARGSGTDLPAVQRSLRYGLDGNVSASVEGTYATHRILLDTLPDANPDLNRLRGAVRYTYAQPWGARPVAEDRTVTEKPGSRLRALLGGAVTGEEALQETGGDADFADAEFRDGQLRGPVAGRRFMHARLLDTTVLRDLHSVYGTDLFVFVNQLELRTNYAHCLDRATNNFVREISLHYSIYDHRGRLFAGDVVTVLVASNTNDLYDVMASAFPPLADAVARGLPNRRYVRASRAEP